MEDNWTEIGDKRRYLIVSVREIPPKYDGYSLKFIDIYNDQKNL